MKYTLKHFIKVGQTFTQQTSVKNIYNYKITNYNPEWLQNCCNDNHQNIHPT